MTLTPRYTPLRFTGKGSDIFSRNGLISVLALVSIFGIPIFTVYINRYLAKHTATSKGGVFSFVGEISACYAISFLSVVVSLTRIPLGKFYGLFDSTASLWIAILVGTFIYYAMLAAVGYLFLNYQLRNLRWSDGRQTQVSIPVIKYIIFSVIATLSFFTLIGWAWFYTWFFRWLAMRVTSDGVTIRFVGTGFGFLWRTTVTTLAIITVVTAPWAIAWYWRWFASTIEIQDTKLSLDNSMGEYSSDQTIREYARSKPVLDLIHETKIGHVESARQVRENIEALLNLKKLLDAGVVTEEEFDLKKKALLKEP